MKQLFLIAALAVTGFMSAKMTEVALPKKEDVKKEITQVLLRHQWVAVNTWCGKVFYLDMNMYTHHEEFLDDAYLFSERQCGNIGDNPGPIFTD